MLLRRSGLAEKLLCRIPGGRSSILKLGGCSPFTSHAAALPLQPESGSASREEYADINWDELGFSLQPTDYMFLAKCSAEEGFSRGEINRYGNIELSPSAGVLNYGQGLFEGMKAFRKEDGRGLLLFRPEENAKRMRMGAERMCMPCPSVELFLHAVKQTVLANKRWVPPAGKGALYLRPLLLGTGPILGLAPSPEYSFLIYASPVGNYFKEGLAPIHLLIGDGVHRATPGGAGYVKTITNYAPVLKAQREAKGRGFTEVLFLDSTNKRYLEEASSCNVFIVKTTVARLQEDHSFKTN